MTSKEPLYDQAVGPNDGVVELLIFQPDEWESDPLLIKRLRQRIRALHEFAAGPKFEEQFHQSRPLLVVQGEQFPPEEVYDLLVKQEVEFRIGKVKRKTTPPSSPSPKPAAKAAPRPAAKAAPKPAAKAAPKPAAKAAPKPAAKAAPKPAAKPAPKPVVAPEPWEMEDYDDLDLVQESSGQGSSTGFIAGLVLTALSLVLFGSGLLQSMKKAPAPTLKTLGVKSIDGNTTKHNTYASISVTPDRGTFSVIPIQDRNSTTAEYYVLFAAKENRSALVFVPQAQSGVLQVKMVEDPADPTSKKPSFVWSKKLTSKTFNGTLEKLQRVKNGSLELKLPDGYKDITKRYAKQSVTLPSNAMVLRVGEKPPAPSNSGGLVALVGLLLVIVFGFFSVVQRQQMRRSF